MRRYFGLTGLFVVAATLSFVNPAQASTIAVGDNIQAAADLIPPADFSFLGQEPPANLIVQAGGLEWVWAAPCAPLQPSCDSAVVQHHGFTIPTAAQWTLSWASRDALIAAFTTPAGGQLCASPYFSTNYDHCDSGDLQIGAIWHAPAPIGDPIYFENGASEAFFVRGASVPEPATIGLVLTGLGLAARRRRKV